jgi:hypothetical protein
VQRDRHINILRKLLTLLVLTIVFAALGSILLLPGHAVVKGARHIPVPLHSALQADYSVDPHNNTVSSVKLSLIDASLNDRNAAEFIDTIYNTLLTPVPMVTSINPVSTLPAITPIFTNTQPPSSVLTPGATLAHTSTQSHATSTQQSTPRTATRVPPIQNTPTQPAMPTSVKPTETPPPAATPTSMPTSTKTSTPTTQPTATNQPYPPPRTSTPAGYP